MITKFSDLPPPAKTLGESWAIWRRYPNAWIRDWFAGSIVPSNQQYDAFAEVGNLGAAKIKASKGLELTAEELRYSKYIGIDISSGMGSGKDFWASVLMYWMLSVWPKENGQYPHGLATANTSKQLKNVLWRQASAIPAMSRKLNPKDPKSERILESMFSIQKEKIFRKELNGNTFYFEAVTVPPSANPEEQAKALTGRHAPYMLMILDEAAGLPEPVFSNLESTLTGRFNFIIMIYNPIRSRGYAVEARNSDSWLSLNWNTEDTFFGNPQLDNPIKARNSDLLKRFGRESNAYRIRVLGRPPLADTEVFIPWDWVQDAVERDITPADDDLVAMGIDPAAGGDNSAIVVRKGPLVLAVLRKSTPSKTDLLDWATDQIHKYKPDAIMVDCIGVGWGFSDDLKKIRGYKKKVYPINVSRTSRQSDKYATVRDEMWGTIKDMLDVGSLSLPNDDELINQLGSILVKDYDKKGGAKMPKKKELKKKESVGKSPDEAEALCLTTTVSENIIRKNSFYDEDEAEERARKKRNGRKGRNTITGY